MHANFFEDELQHNRRDRPCQLTGSMYYKAGRCVYRVKVTQYPSNINI